MDHDDHDENPTTQRRDVLVVSVWVDTGGRLRGRLTGWPEQSAGVELTGEGVDALCAQVRAWLTGLTGLTGSGVG